MVMSVSVRVQSSSATCAELSALAGRAPTRCAEVGSPVSSRNTQGPVFEVTTWVARVSSSAELIPDEALELIGRIRKFAADINVDVICRVDAKPLGNMIELPPQTLGAIANLGASLILDVYDGDG
jgi:hypothetical protein